MNKDYYKIKFGEMEATYNAYNSILTTDSFPEVRIEVRVPRGWSKKKIIKFAENLLKSEL